MRVRAATVGDEELLAKLNGLVQDVHLQHRPHHFKPTQLPELAAWYRSVLENPTTRMWIAEERDVAIGYVMALLRHLPETPFTRAKAWLEIDQIAIDHNHRRRGVGRALVLAAIDAASAEGVHHVEATVWCFNVEANETFRHLGFTPKSVRFELRAEDWNKSV
jgi:ribosomal protein S18 acetylase RimI-like enzyme